MRRWKLISKTANLIYIESERKNDCCETVQNHCGEPNPAGVKDNISVPPTCDQKNNHGEQQDATDKYENQRYEPFDGKCWSEACWFSVVQTDALPHQSETVAICFYDPIWGC